jgi:hypothetical protein
VVDQELDRVRAEAAGGAAIALGRAAGEAFDEADPSFQDRALHFDLQPPGILVAVAVVADLVPVLHDTTTFRRECFDGVARHEPGRLDAVFREQVEQPSSADLAELSAGQRIRRFGAEVRDPHRHRIEIVRQAYGDVLRHRHSSIDPSGLPF